MSDSKKTRCTQSVYVDGRWRTRCSLPGKMEHEGKLYCVQHHPPTKAARRKAKQEERSQCSQARYAVAERDMRRRTAGDVAFEALRETDPAWHAALEAWIENGGEMPRRGA